MKAINILLLLSCTVLACKSPNNKLEIFDASGQKPITSFVSKKLNTVSILFGNEKAMVSAIMGVPHKGGEIFTLVTWNQEHKRFWYPGLINGRIKSIEVVKITLTKNSVQSSYTLTKGEAPYNLAHRGFNERERIEYITSQKASIYP
jgi:hypothetical protein